MILGITGHRKFGGRFDNLEMEEKVVAALSYQFRELAPEKIITGMAIGTDQLAARAALICKIPFIAAVPFIGQERMWKSETITAYNTLLNQAEEVVIVSPGGYADWKMHARNKYIVDNSNEMLAVLSPGAKGGTASCVSYAEAWKKTIHYINPDQL